MSLAWVHASSRVEGLALPMSVESGNLSFSKTGIRWMSVYTRLSRGAAFWGYCALFAAAAVASVWLGSGPRAEIFLFLKGRLA
jgi:hypothetical protein